MQAIYPLNPSLSHCLCRARIIPPASPVLIFCGCRRLPDYVLVLTLKPMLALALAVSSMTLLLTSVMMLMLALVLVRVHLVFLRAGSYPISNLRFSQRLFYFGVLDACCA